MDKASEFQIGIQKEVIMGREFKTSGISKFSIGWRRLIHNPLAAIFKLSLGRKIKLIRNDFVPNGKPTIFAATHVFYDDIATILCCLKDSAYLLIEADNRESMPTGVDCLALELNGVVTVDRNDKQSRARAFDNMVNVLSFQGNILLFPEAAWNFSPNALVAKMHWGIIRIAEHANANVVPVAVNLVGNDYCVSIGNYFECQNYSSHSEAIDALRDEMATLVWELISLCPPAQREVLNDKYWLAHIREQCGKRPLEDRDKEEGYMFRSKGEISLGEVLADMHGLEYKSMAADYEQYCRIERLIGGWTKPVSFPSKTRELD